MAKVALIALWAVALTAWYLVGAPFPGRYQIVYGNGPYAVLDTMTGKIRLIGGKVVSGDKIRLFDVTAE
jgi:hypothetical protein